MEKNLSVIDAKQKAHSYAGLARSYATGANDAWLALHAQLAADTAAAVAVGGQVPALGALLPELTKEFAGDARRVLVSLRALIAARLDEDTCAAWSEMIADPEYLADLPPATPDYLASLTAARGITDDGIEEAINAKEEQASALAEEARAALSSGDEETAINALYDGDLCKFEEWLLRRAVAAEDTGCASVELTWSLAVGALSQVDWDRSAREVQHQVRSRLAWAVGPGQARSLAAVLL